MANRHIDFNSAALPVLDMAHVRETIELHRTIQEAVRIHRKRRAERIRELTGKK